MSPKKLSLSLMMMCLFAAMSVCAESVMPAVKVEPLAGSSLTLPDDLPHRPCIFVVGFSKASRAQTMQWSQRLEQETLAEKASVYSVAVLEDVPAFVRGLIVKGIRKSVPDALHARFLVASSDAAAWKDAVMYSDADAAYLILVNEGREIVWRMSGPLTDATLRSLVDAVNAI